MLSYSQKLSLKLRPCPSLLPCLKCLGYSMYCNFEPRTPNLGKSGKRGICVYASAKLNVTEVAFPDCPFEEQLWVQLSLAGQDRLLLGCVYRSPSGNGQQDTNDLIQLLEHVTSAGYSHLLIAGDFNMPQIDWKLETIIST